MMGDDLIERLRRIEGDVTKYNRNPDGLEAADEIERQSARIARLEEALDSIDIYGSDTLSGRVDGPADKDWFRDAVREMRDRARIARMENDDE